MAKDLSADTTEDPVTLKELALRDYLRLRNKGPFGIVFSVVLAITLLYTVEYVGKTFWPAFLEYVTSNGIPIWRVNFFVPWAINIMSFLIANLAYTFVYSLNHPFFEQYKVLKTEKWPWLEDPKAWNKFMWKSIGLVCINGFIVFPIVLYTLALITNFKITHTYAVEDLPDKFTIMWQVAYSIYAEDALFSIAHRILHTPFLYKHVHKVHHTYTQAVGISATYTHPIEYALGNMLPVGIPCMILGKRMHFYTFLVFTTLRIVATTSGHSGYDFPWIPWDVMPLRGSPTYHDYHHSGGDFSGNYSGQSTVLDTIWGTNKKYFKMYKREMLAKFGYKKSD